MLQSPYSEEDGELMAQIPLEINMKFVALSIVLGKHPAVLISVLVTELKLFQSKRWVVAQVLATAELALDLDPL